MRPPLQRLGMAALMVATGLVPFIGMAIYVRLYVVWLWRQGPDVQVTVIGLLSPSTLTYTVSDIGPARAHRGEFRGRLTVNAPWMTLRIAGRPYIIDLQAEWIDRPAIQSLVSQGSQAGKPNRAARRRRSR